MKSVNYAETYNIVTEPQGKCAHFSDRVFGMDCVKKARKRHVVRKMKVGPSEPPCRRRLQTAISCFGPKGRGGERYG